MEIEFGKMPDCTTPDVLARQHIQGCIIYKPDVVSDLGIVS